MTRTFRLAAILSIGSAMALTTLAHAQAPGMPPGAPGAPGGMRPGMPGPGGPGMAGGGQGGAAGAETITNTDSISSTTFVDPIGGEASVGDDSTSSLPNTGGEPLVMVLGGLALAASAFAVRRKLA